MNKNYDGDLGCRSSITSQKPYIPSALSEIEDHLGSMMLKSPHFEDRTELFPGMSSDSSFFTLNSGLERMREKLGEDVYARAIELSGRAKALFLQSPDIASEKTREGNRLLDEIDQLINAVRRHRYESGLKDDEGEVTGD
ncbi:hypothetical protein [Sphingomonas sp. BK235]|uniref:hypothetical protein n=1 Tax=Sphingomonas sp. BK235 TaxID=2512131 RepID=UPI0010443A85|nr:hypothetical protein [Sphingomonas sp. BK235]TCP33170.1 hypothetical protein EV292_106112 [Sphingomonas sp. BK235]